MTREATQFVATAVTAAALSETGRAGEALDQAFAALRVYDLGSSRAALVPLDDAVQASLSDAQSRSELEQRLLVLASAGLSIAAREYVCAKLVLIGSAASDRVLAAWLGDPAVADAARNVLEALPGPAATKALRRELPKAQGRQRVGLIHSLGARRDVESVAALTRLLADADPETVSAAAGALGNIGSAAAGRALRRCQAKVPAAIRPAVADACLACAERLRAAGQRREAAALYEILADPRQPKHIQQATQRGLRLL